jgi:hypothetical protein
MIYSTWLFLFPRRRACWGGSSLESAAQNVRCIYKRGDGIRRASRRYQFGPASGRSSGFDSFLHSSFSSFIRIFSYFSGMQSPQYLRAIRFSENFCGCSHTVSWRSTRAVLGDCIPCSFNYFFICFLNFNQMSTSQTIVVFDYIGMLVAPRSSWWCRVGTPFGRFEFL